MLEKLSFYQMCSEAYRNKELLAAYVKGESIENFGAMNTLFGGMYIGAFLVLFILNFILWILALYMLITRAKYMDTWAVVLGAIFLFCGFGVGTIFVVVLNTKKSKSSKKFRLQSTRPRSRDKSSNIYKMVKGTM